MILRGWYSRSLFTARSHLKEVAVRATSSRSGTAMGCLDRNKVEGTSSQLEPPPPPRVREVRPLQDSVDGRIDAAAASTAAASAAEPYSLPQATWSLADLNLESTVRTSAENINEDSPAPAALTPEEVKKICALAHIQLAREGDPTGGLDVSAVQQGVGSMLRLMQTMKAWQDGTPSREEHATRGEEEEEEEGGGGPWGGDVKWMAPMQEDVVSDGDLQGQVLAAAKRTEAGFFTAPRVVGGEEEVP